jgi:hypothetical protein
VGPELMVMSAEKGEYPLSFQQVPETIAIFRIATKIIFIGQVDIEG